MSNSSGLGGGLLFLPVLFLIMDFYPHEAIPISKVVIFAGALSSFCVNVGVKRPGRNVVALDYNLLIICCSNLLLGTVFGVTLNKILPNTIILLLVCIFLSYNTYKTFKTFFKLFNEEKGINNNNSLAEQDNHNYNINRNNDINNICEEEVRKEIEKDQYYIRWDKLMFIVIPYGIMVFLTLLRESNLVSKCSLLYWILIFIYIFVVLFFDYKAMLHIENEFNWRKRINYPFDSRDIQWNRQTVVKLAVIGFIAGFIAGTIGIGGGVVLGPILLGLDIHPIVCTVNTNFLVLLTSSSTTFQFILFNMLNYQYGLLSVIFSALGAFVATKLINEYVKRTGEQSLIVLILFIVVAISALVLFISSVVEITEDYKNGMDIFEFQPLCTTTK